MMRAIFLLLLSFTFIAHSAFALPTVQLNNSIFECAGGWGSIFLYYRNASDVLVGTTSTQAYAAINLNIKNTRSKIKQYQLIYKKANAKTKKQIKKKIDAQNAFLRSLSATSVSIRRCLNGNIVAARPSQISGSGTISSSSYFLLEGAQLFASDGQFLGILSSNAADVYSIANLYGSYGSKYSITSVYNQYGNYGGKYSIKSPFNPYSTMPPIAYLDAQPVAYFTNNQYISDARVDSVAFSMYAGRATDIPW